MHKQKWEYRAHVIGVSRTKLLEDVAYTDGTGDAAGMSEMLADFGEDGWELASSIVVDAEESMILIFKRPKAD